MDHRFLRKVALQLSLKIFIALKNFVPPFGLFFAVTGTTLARVATKGNDNSGIYRCLGSGSGSGSGQSQIKLVRRHPASISTTHTTAMIMALFYGGKLFSVVFLSMGGGDVVADVLLGIDVNRFIVFAIMMAVVFFMGLFIGWPSILLVVVPIFTPIAIDLDFNPLWVAMMICINLQTSFMTSPFGYSLFHSKEITPPDYSMDDVYR